MHATYAFLLSINHEDAADEDGDILKGAELQAVEDFGRYAAKYCDENNWYQEQALVLQDGRVVQMCPSDDWRERNDLYDELKDVPQAERWERARLIALQCVANEFELGGRCPIYLGPPKEPVPELPATFEGLHAHILEEMPARLSDMWRHAGDDMSTTYGDQKAWLRRYQLRKWSRLMCGYLGSMDHHPLISTSHVPFAGQDEPYEGRAFDLTEYGEDGNAILFVDIHT